MKLVLWQAVSALRTLLARVQMQQVLAALMIGVLLITNAEPQGNKALTDKIQGILQQDQTQRPKTTGEFLDEARGDVPLGERVENITRDSVEAFKRLGSEYSEAAKESADAIKDGAVQAGQDLSSRVQP